MPRVSAEKDKPEQISLEVLISLHEQAWENFHERRRHEYKVCLAIWTLYALAIGQIIASGISFNWIIRVLFSTFMIVLMLFHFQWIHGLAAANLMDRKFAFFYSRKMRELGNIELPKSITDDHMYMKEDKKFSFLTIVLNWNHRVEIGVTVILTSVVVVLLVLM